jgi:hypothetical protein
MVKTIKGRTIAEGQRVAVYYNLHKHCYSIKDKRTGLVIAHADKVTLSGVQFKVSQAGRARVLREKRKNVHATIEGNYTSQAPAMDKLAPAYYNPYTCSSFIDKGTGKPLDSATLVHCTNKQALYR